MENSKLQPTVLRAICKLITDGTHDSPKLLESGVPFIKATHISTGAIDFDNCDYISYEDHLKVISRSKPELGDTLFTNIGMGIGDAAYVTTNREFSIKNVALLKPDPEKVDSLYLHYLLRSPRIQAELKNKRSGSAQPFIGLDTIRNHETLIHSDLAIQKHIGATLWSFDRLIQLNERRIAILVESARLLFRQWFVNLRLPGEAQSSSDTSRSLPDGWEQVTIQDLYNTTSGGTPSRKCSDYYGGAIRWVKTKELTDGFMFDTEETITELGLRKSSAKLFGPRTVLIAMYGATIGQLGILTREAASNQACCALIEKSEVFTYQYIFLHLMENKNKLIKLGQGAAQQNINQIIIRNFPILKPPPGVMQKFNELVSPMLESIRIMQRQNIVLRDMRDLLIPKLINGEFATHKFDGRQNPELVGVVQK